jgi:hypothetical protein
MVVPNDYRRREPEKTALYQVVQNELESFIAEHEAAGRYLPSFVVKQLEAFLKCGIPAHGFVLKECEACSERQVVAFSCKRRGLCPSCASRRMSATAAHLVDHVYPAAPVRQWTVTLPVSIRYIIGYDADLCREVHGLAVDAIYRWMRDRAKKELRLSSSQHLECGSVGFIHRARGDLALFVHYHIAVIDGVFVDNGLGNNPTFRALGAPDRKDLRAIAERLGRQVNKLLQRRGILDCDFDRFAEEQPLLAGCSSAAVRGTIASGRRAGQRVRRIRGGACQPREASGCACEAGGFNVHAGLRVPASERGRLERVLRYAARGPVANDRLEIQGDDLAVYRLQRPWSDGTTAVMFSFHELMERLVAIVPRPHFNMTIYSGVLAPRHNLRDEVVPRATVSASEDAEEQPTRSNRWFPWAELLRRVHLIDVLTCPNCGRQFQHLACVFEAGAIKQILQSCGLPTAPPPRAPARCAQAGLGFDEFDQTPSYEEHWDAA